MKKIVIFGTGKLSFALASGFQLATQQQKLSAKIVVIGREKESLERFRSLESVHATVGYADLAESDCCIFCISPTGAQELYQKVGLFLKESVRLRTIISLTSGVNVPLATTLLGVPYGVVVCGTTNINVSRHLAYSVFTGVHGCRSQLQLALDLFRLLGSAYSVRSYKNVTKSIGVVGSGAAFDAMFLLELLRYLRRSMHISTNAQTISAVSGFIEKGFEYGIVHEDRFMVDWQDCVKRSVSTYLRAKVEYAISLGYGPKSAWQISAKTLANSADFLLKGECTEVAIKCYIDSVATKGGSTEKGLMELSSLLDSVVFRRGIEMPDFLQFSERYGKIMIPVHRRVRQFKQDALK